jgi:haloacid dehalogenase-like hydrolase
MRYFALATDYDGTLTTAWSAPQLEALERFGDTGRKLLLVTGRELPDLMRVFPSLDLFDRVVAENGALIYCPTTREEQSERRRSRPSRPLARPWSDPATPENRLRRGSRRAGRPGSRTARRWPGPERVASHLSRLRLALRLGPPRGERRRHLRKYAEGTLAEDKSF